MLNFWKCISLCWKSSRSKKSRYFLLTSQEVALFQADYDHPAKFKNLVAESENSAILDSGASNTVTGQSRINTYIESLDDQDKTKIVFCDSTNVYRFGNSKTIPATRNVDIPVMIGSKQFTLNTDVKPNNIQLLLSKKSMTTANMTLDFKNEPEFGEPEQLSQGRDIMLFQLIFTIKYWLMLQMEAMQT